jgi:tetratricopeptide (TPR) repeat protein
MSWLRTFFGSAAERPAGPSALEWRDRGNLALGEGRLDAAAACYQQAVEADPRDPLARINLGFVRLEQGDPAAAMESLRQALILRKDEAVLHEAHYLMALASRAMGKLTDALDHLDRALAAQPGFVHALELSVRVLQDLGRNAQALPRAQQLAAISPTVPAQLLLARQLYLLARNEQARQVLDEVLASQPRNLDALSGSGHVLLKLGRAREALARFEQREQIEGEAPGNLADAAAACQRLGDVAGAMRRLQRALALQPGNAAALCNLVFLLTEELRFDEAIATARGALELHPDDADLHWNLALALLHKGDLEAGWREHEWRWKSAAFTHVERPGGAIPTWNGEPLEGRKILVFAEQGFGDALQFARYVQLLDKADSVLLQVQPAIRPVLEGIAPNARLVHSITEASDADYQWPLLSLPHVFGTTIETIPARVPYLKRPGASRHGWRERLSAIPGFKVGICWSGNPAQRNDHHRSMPLQIFRELATDACVFVNLQPTVRESDRPALDAWDGLVRFDGDLTDFGETAALMQELDLVITVCTSVAHLAGGLGLPVWVLLTYAADWRWLLHRHDSPWYPTARLYRQSERGNWHPVVAQARRDLEALAGSRGQNA